MALTSLLPDIFSSQVLDAADQADPDDFSWLSMPALIKRFTLGDCHYLAVELHKQTGWQLRSLIRRNGKADYHAFVVTPDELALDIHGLHPLESLVQSYGGFGHVVVKPKQFSNWGCHRGMGQRNEAYDQEATWLAEKTARALLSKHCALVA